MGATPQQGSIASETRSVTRIPGCNERDRLPVEDHLSHAQAGGGGQQWENPQVSDGFSRSGERIGYDAQSLPPV